MESHYTIRGNYVGALLRCAVYVARTCSSAHVLFRWWPCGCRSACMVYDSIVHVCKHPQACPYVHSERCCEPTTCRKWLRAYSTLYRACCATVYIEIDDQVHPAVSCPLGRSVFRSLGSNSASSCRIQCLARLAQNRKNRCRLSIF